MNKVILVGNLVADPTFNKTITNQKSVCNMRVATNRKYYNTQKELVEVAEFHNVVVWGRDAENAAQYLRKGSKVCIEGELTSREFQGKATYAGTKQDIVDANGQQIMINRYTTEIVAQRVEYHSKKPVENTYAQTPGTAPAFTPAAAPAPAAVQGTFVPPAPGPGAFVAPAANGAVAPTAGTVPPVALNLPGTTPGV